MNNPTATLLATEAFAATATIVTAASDSVKTSECSEMLCVSFKQGESGDGLQGVFVMVCSTSELGVSPVTNAASERAALRSRRSFSVT